MAGGKENARQKMINLMYLVFIAMLALNMSKEVLMTFGEIDREVVKSTKSLKESNKAAIQVIKNSAKNDSLQWFTAYQPISKISEAANELTEFINRNDNELGWAPKENVILSGKIKKSLNGRQYKSNYSTNSLGIRSLQNKYGKKAKTRRPRCFISRKKF